jgi:hypothetical protein
LVEDFELERRLIAEHDAWLEAGIASDGSRRMAGARHNLKPYPLIPMTERRINVTDPDSRNLKTTRGWVQGYNAQAVVTEAQIVIAAEISTESLDTANLQTEITAAEEELHAAGVTDRLDIVLADAGYWTNSAIQALAAEGLQPLVAADADRRKEPRPGRRGGLYDVMRRVLATERGSQLYRRRQATIAPVFGQIKANRGADRFLRRGRSASDRNGGCSRRPTSCSSSTDTDSKPPEARPDRRPSGLRRRLIGLAPTSQHSRRSPPASDATTFPRHPPRLPAVGGRCRCHAQTSSEDRGLSGRRQFVRARRAVVARSLQSADEATLVVDTVRRPVRA